MTYIEGLKREMHGWPVCAECGGSEWYEFRVGAGSFGEPPDTSAEVVSITCALCYETYEFEPFVDDGTLEGDQIPF